MSPHHPIYLDSASSHSDLDHYDRTSSVHRPAHKALGASVNPLKKEIDDWWICSTAIPLVAATLGPLANVLSIAALVTYWRVDLAASPDGGPLPELQGEPFPDPRWCYAINAVSLTCGFVGNLFLLANFTGRIRYIVALPATIISWSLATATLIGIVLGMHMYAPPVAPSQTYSEGFWYAIFAAAFYLFCSLTLMFNMLGHFLGHYGQQFNLTDSQQTLILQTMMFFVWLAGGAGVFAAVGGVHGQQDWAFVDALYFCDVTILTVGFGDLVPANNVARGLVLPYSVGGTITLGLVMSSLSRFAAELSETNIIRKHAETRRVRAHQRSSSILNRNTAGTDKGNQRKDDALELPTRRRPKLELLQGERDRFNAMRHIQASALRLRRYLRLSLSIFTFAVLWLAGAGIFYATEANTQDLSYFEALYFCYVSLLTIGYGDFTPKSNGGRPFFVVWSLLAVPSMTILVSALGDTVIRSFKEGTELVARFTVLPRYGVWRKLYERFQAHDGERGLEHRAGCGFLRGLAGADDVQDVEERERKPTLEELALASAPSTPVALSAELTKAIKRAAKDAREQRTRYSYEDWVEFTALIRAASHLHSQEADDDEGEEAGLDDVDWDWLGDDSPMVGHLAEAEFVLQRLCESLQRCLGVAKCE